MPKDEEYRNKETKELINGRKRKRRASEEEEDENYKYAQEEQEVHPRSATTNCSFSLCALPELPVMPTAAALFSNSNAALVASYRDSLI